MNKHKTIIGYDPATPGGDISTAVIGHQDEQGVIHIDQVLEGHIADRFATICILKAKVNRNLIRRNVFNNTLMRLRREGMEKKSGL